ncbi:hypothetical protein [Olene mendosa nucleopolyhedrovirus]|uniref:C2H2-type domain-containing protein n=1 Tax=Olene mendosa nucleopolyhedrovirus TaxID=2933796 RepID=A0AAX3AU51_9ABAC|nr:hypothetical protein QKV28_gp101 [Olene mendosa nucleopolyhedrovirus]UOQ18884.1 hypothetical protein [Olene mendosa nucleopolyhedrovirus]
MDASQNSKQKPLKMFHRWSSHGRGVGRPALFVRPGTVRRRAFEQAGRRQSKEKEMRGKGGARGDCGESSHVGGRGPIGRHCARKRNCGPLAAEAGQSAKAGPFQKTIKFLIRAQACKPCITHAIGFRNRGALHFDFEQSSFEDYEYREMYDKYLRRAKAPVTCGKCAKTMKASQYPEHLTTVHNRRPLQLSCVWCDDRSVWDRHSASGLMFEHMFCCLRMYVQQNGAK